MKIIPFDEILRRAALECSACRELFLQLQLVERRLGTVWEDPPDLDAARVLSHELRNRIQSAAECQEGCATCVWCPDSERVVSGVSDCRTRTGTSGMALAAWDRSSSQ
ncbi:MAG TPA: hypothetical protein PLU30_00780 [Verrucomicrobiae bacterium]|nr:hypothetical protein [Verrucomicrobiae bacterium]